MTRDDKSKGSQYNTKRLTSSKGRPVTIPTTVVNREDGNGGVVPLVGVGGALEGTLEAGEKEGVFKARVVSANFGYGVAELGFFGEYFFDFFVFGSFFFRFEFVEFGASELFLNVFEVDDAF